GDGDPERPARHRDAEPLDCAGANPADPARGRLADALYALDELQRTDGDADAGRRGARNAGSRHRDDERTRAVAAHVVSVPRRHRSHPAVGIDAVQRVDDVKGPRHTVDREPARLRNQATREMDAQTDYDVPRKAVAWIARDRDPPGDRIENGVPAREPRAVGAAEVVDPPDAPVPELGLPDGVR